MASPAANTTSTSSAPVPTPVSAPSVPTTATTEPMPSTLTLLQATRLAMNQDKQIAFDYFLDTLQGKAFIAEDPESKDKVLVKSRDEYTSQVVKTYRVGDEFLIVTENTIYIVSSKIQKRKFPHNMLHQDEHD